MQEGQRVNDGRTNTENIRHLTEAMRQANENLVTATDIIADLSRRLARLEQEVRDGSAVPAPDGTP